MQGGGQKDMPALIDYGQEVINDTPVFEESEKTRVVGDVAEAEQAIQEQELDISPISAIDEYSEHSEQSKQKELQQKQAEVVARALAGDEGAFQEIISQYSTLMLRTAWTIVKDRDIAEDVVQDALIQMWHHLPDLREASSLRPWLMRIVVNQCISFKRRLARSTAFTRQAIAEQESDLLASAAEHHKGHLERNWDLAQAVENLPLKQKIAIKLHYYDGMTLPEMSRSLQISENTLKKRIQAALTNLRTVLKGTDLDDVHEELALSAAA
jgi:RNA polymerase sigma-70 factor, ECF subfamily